MRAIVLLPVLIASTAVPLAAQWGRDGYSADRDGRASATSVRRVDVRTGSGSLRIVGRGTSREVRAQGTARASDRDILREVELRVERRGDVVYVETILPERLRNRQWAMLELTVELPDGVDVSVSDGSGAVEVRDVGALDLTDGSGEVHVEHVSRGVRIHDGSGQLVLTDIGGDVVVKDGSGGMEIRTVRGSVLIESDGSGSVEIRDVQRSVRIASKGSGSVRVDRVRGDFVVDRKGSGSISYGDVDGRVDVPRGRRER